MIYIENPEEENEINIEETSNQQPEQEPASSKRDWSDPALLDKPAASWFLPDDYFDKRKEEEGTKNADQRKKELGKLKALAIGDTLRLLGSAAQIKRGAHETPWKNDNMETGFKNLDRYDAQHAAALDKLQDMEIKNRQSMFANQKESDRYNAETKRREEQAQYAREQDAEQTKWQRENADRNYDLAKERIEVDKAYKNDIATSRQIAANASATRANNSNTGTGKKTDPNKTVQATDGASGRIYNFNLDDANDRESVSQMAKTFMSDVLNKEIMEQWQAKNSPEWNALNNLLNKKWDRDAVSAIMPYILKSDVADQYQVPSTVRTQQPTQPAPKTQPPTWSSPATRTNNLPVPPPQPGQSIPLAPTTQRGQVIPFAPTTQPAKDNGPSEPLSFSSFSARPKTRESSSKEGELIQSNWAVLQPEDRKKKIYLRIEQLAEIKNGKPNENLKQSDGSYRMSGDNKAKLSKDIAEYYFYNKQDKLAQIELVAKKRGITTEQMISNMIDITLSKGQNFDALIQ